MQARVRRNSVHTAVRCIYPFCGFRPDSRGPGKCHSGHCEADVGGPLTNGEQCLCPLSRADNACERNGTISYDTHCLGVSPRHWMSFIDKGIYQAGGQHARMTWSDRATLFWLK
ncbi:hypothetical protein LY76DRAFT_31948 [Colletotrichum caudatum]|nr:hypothetical protein LY76DRAFT_31948 [Colletotrichum caudatum]